MILRYLQPRSAAAILRDHSIRSTTSSREFVSPAADVRRQLCQYVDPSAGARDPFASRDARGVANDGYDVTMSARPGAENAKTILGIVVGHSLDEARQNFLGQ